MKAIFWATLAALVLGFGPARAACDASLPAPTSLRSAATVAEYAPALKICHGAGGDQVAIRTMRLSGEAALLLADPETLTTRLERAACWTCADAEEDALKDTRMMRAIESLRRRRPASAAALSSTTPD